MKIPVTYKKFIFYSEIDNEDAERVLKINWSIKIDGNRLYRPINF